MIVDDFKATLSKGHLYKALYHFTSRENLESISKHGLVSKAFARKNNVSIPVYGGNRGSGTVNPNTTVGESRRLAFRSSGMHFMSLNLQFFARSRSSGDGPADIVTRF
jgi:hypothetical protein